MKHIVTADPVSTKASHTRFAFALVTSLFLVWGFLTALNDILVPHFKLIFDLNYARVMLTQFMFFAGYVVMAVPSGRVVSWIGYHRSMVAGLTTMALGALLFVPASSLVSWPLFLAALFLLASGITLLQVSSNPYVIVLGPKETASSRLNLSQAFNSVGTAIAPLVGGSLILSLSPITIEQLRQLPSVEQAARKALESSTVRMPYLVFSLLLFLLAFFLSRVPLPSVPNIEQSGDDVVINGRMVRSIWRVPHLLLGVGGIFFYCGAEVSIGSFLVSFLSSPDIADLSPRAAAHHVSLYWSGMMVGRFAGAILLRYFPAGSLLGVFALAASSLVWITMATSGHIAMWTILAVGLFNSIMFPSIFSLAIDGLGKLTSQGSGLLFMATLGPAIIPVFQGLLADRIGVHHAFVVPALCYLYVVYYGFLGSRHRNQLSALSPAGT